MLHPKHILKSGKVILWDLGPDEKDPTREHWEKAVGAHQIEFFAVDAKHALTVEPDRFVHKLPSGTKTGPAQVARERAVAEEAGLPADPHFGEKT